MIFLFNDLLVETKPMKKSGVEVFKLKHSYHLVQVQPVDIPDTKGTSFSSEREIDYLCSSQILTPFTSIKISDTRFGFSLMADGDTVMVKLYAASAEEKEYWMKDLCSLRNEIEDRRKHYNGTTLKIAETNFYSYYFLTLVDSFL